MSMSNIWAGLNGRAYYGDAIGMNRDSEYTIGPGGGGGVNNYYKESVRNAPKGYAADSKPCELISNSAQMSEIDMDTEKLNIPPWKGCEPKQELPDMNKYKLVFHYTNGKTYTATRVYSFNTISSSGVYDDGEWGKCHYARKKDQYTIEHVVVPIHDCIAMEVWDNSTGEVTVKRNPCYSVVLDIGVSTGRSKIKINNKIANSVRAMQKDSRKEDDEDVVSYMG